MSLGPPIVDGRTKGFDWGLYSVFSSPEALQKYAVSKEHVDVVTQHVRPNVEGEFAYLGLLYAHGRRHGVRLRARRVETYATGSDYCAGVSLLTVGIGAGSTLSPFAGTAGTGPTLQALLTPPPHLRHSHLLSSSATEAFLRPRLRSRFC